MKVLLSIVILLTKIIAGFLFLVIIIIGGIQYMKANPSKVQTSYLVEGLLIGFFVGMMISIVIDWQWIGIGAGLGQFIGMVIGSQISKQEKR